MKLRVYRSLDRPAAFFGIRGKYQSLALYAFLLDLVVSFLIARVTNGLIGILAFITLGGMIYLGTIYIQDKYSDRTLMRLFASRRLPGYIKMIPGRISSLFVNND